MVVWLNTWRSLCCVLGRQPRASNTGDGDREALVNVRQNSLKSSHLNNVADGVGGGPTDLTMCPCNCQLHVVCGSTDLTIFVYKSAQCFHEANEHGGGLVMRGCRLFHANFKLSHDGSRIFVVCCFVLFRFWFLWRPELGH